MRVVVVEGRFVFSTNVGWCCTVRLGEVALSYPLKSAQTAFPTLDQGRIGQGRGVGFGKEPQLNLVRYRKPAAVTVRGAMQQQGSATLCYCATARRIRFSWSGSDDRRDIANHRHTKPALRHVHRHCMPPTKRASPFDPSVSLTARRKESPATSSKHQVGLSPNKRRWRGRHRQSGSLPILRR